MKMPERSEDVTNGVRSSKIIIKESSQVNSSSRIYYYGGASVPFMWETRPGTPKHCESFRLPPLTPPPSYYSSSSGKQQSKSRTKQCRFVKTLFNGKHHVSRPSLSWSSTTSSSSSSSSFSSSSPPSKGEHRPKKCYLSCSRSYVKDDEEEEIGSSSSSPTSTLCYKRGFSSSMGSMKRALCSVLSHGSSRKDLRLI
uniref:Uncharacterized protein n=1 Tax=Noccaea caerulescens TaxID=107243 RepID=A0A1J3HVJ0_NOCCA